MVNWNSLGIFLGIISSTNILFMFVALVLFGLPYKIIYNHIFHPLSSYPGPFFAGVTRIWIAWHNYVEDETVTRRDLMQKHGPVVRISPNLLLVAKVGYLSDIYHRRAAKTKHYNLLGFGRTPSVFHSIEHADHASRRRMVASAYNFLSVKGLGEVIDRRTIQWIAQLKSRFEGGKEFDFSPWAAYLTLDIIGKVTFGKDLRCVEQGCDAAGLNKGFKAGLFAFGFVTRMHVAEVGSPCGNLDERFKTKRYKLLDPRGSEGEAMMVDSLYAESTIMLLAGADTIATTGCAAIIHIPQSPPALAKVLSEHRAARERGLLSQLPQQSEVLEHCPYYVACLKESVRWESNPGVEGARIDRQSNI